MKFIDFITYLGYPFNIKYFLKILRKTLFKKNLFFDDTNSAKKMYQRNYKLILD